MHLVENAKRKIQTIRRLTRIGIFAVLGLFMSFYLVGGQAYAQTSTGTMDMTPLITVIVSIIPVFIMISLLDKLMGRFRG